MHLDSIVHVNHGSGLAPHAIAGLQLGAFGVVLETWFSGISSLPFRSFVLLMQPIHLAIGLAEGFATAALVGFLAHACPEALLTLPAPAAGRRALRPVLLGLLAAAVVLGGIVSWFASTHPDGLEWSIAKVTGAPAAAETTGQAGRSVTGLLGGLITLALAGGIGLALRRRGPAKKL